MAKRPSRGFTFLEMTAVVFILALVATGVMLKLSASSRGDEDRAFRAGLVRLATQARQNAISSGQTVSLSYDDNARRFEVRSAAAQTNTSAQSAALTSVDLPVGVYSRGFQVAGSDVSGGDWQIRFYTDGTCDAGAIDFSNPSGDEFTLTFEAKTGSSRITVSGDAATTDERWPAGEMEHRGGG